ncbi:MAG TPA: chemotaxis-specific protein-glutamate methyltransferase CheB [Longimicrobiales bacterium]|nr:chemotaxis-specific protein-glutamate methyltransferase CheB [Longimicrobiales bacterium]
MRASASSGQRAVRVLAVDDSAFILRAIERMAADWAGVRLVGTARNGEEAVAEAAALEPDVIILDISMPGVDGLEALARIMSAKPVPVILFSSLAQADADVTLRGLELGAVDFVDKGSAGTAMDVHALAPLLHRKILDAAGASPVDPREHPALPAIERPPEVARAPSAYDLIVVGTSTGGPRALGRIIPRLPADFGASIVVVQHMPEGFTRSLAERLDRNSAIPVSEARHGAALEPGEAFIAPAGMEFSVQSDGEGVLRAHVGAPTGRFRHAPSVDGVLLSAADVVGPRAIGVVLTGMGEDGAEGLKALRDAGGRTIAESRNTTIIDGMPRAARPAAEIVAPLDFIAQVLVDLSAGRRSTQGG